MKIRPPHRFYFSKWYWYWLKWQKFWRFFHSYGQLKDLNNLIEWAGRKRLTEVKSAYLRRYNDLECRLFNEQLRNLKLATWSYRLYVVVSFLTPTPCYHRGYAAKYKYEVAYRNL